MNIPIFLAAGMAAEFVLALIRPLRGATRGLVCWSVSAVVLSMCCAVYFISSGDITFDLSGAIRGIGGAGVLVLIAALIELFSPSRRSRQKPEQDPQRSEHSLNIVLSVAAGILCAASLALSLFGERDTAALLLVPPTAAALRQTLWFMKSAGAEHPATQREKLAERISCGKYKL